MNRTLLNEMGFPKVMQATWLASDTSLDHDFEICRRGGILIQDLEGASFWELMAAVRGESPYNLRKLNLALTE